MAIRFKKAALTTDQTFSNEWEQNGFRFVILYSRYRDDIEDRFSVQGLIDSEDVSMTITDLQNYDPVAFQTSFKKMVKKVRKLGKILQAE